MALVVKDRAQESSASTGTGTIILDGASAGFQDFSVIGNGNTTYYTIVDAATGDWEVGIGTYTAIGTTLSRDTVLESSSGGTAINFAAGVKDVFVTYPAERSVDTTTPQTLSSKTLASPVYTGTLTGGGAATIDGLTVGRGAGNSASNTALGASALQNNTGFNNTATGRDALLNNTTGSLNTATGDHALRANTAGGQNTATGRAALALNTTGSENTATGRDALFNNTTGVQNTATGRAALRANTTGFNNTATGRDALRANTTGFNNTANGSNALSSNTSGANNTANGFDALTSNTSGTGNTANGVSALRDTTTGTSNTANGINALQRNTTGSRNTANGDAALLLNTSGEHNTASGARALFNNTTGINNTAIGMDALIANSTGNNNLGIGFGAGGFFSPRNITTASDEICIGNNDHTGAFIKIAFTVTSDARDKAALAPIPHGLDFVNALLPTEYQFKVGGRDGEADGKRRYGFLAQDVLAAEGENPVIVNNDDPDSLKMTSDYLIPVLVNAIKELTAELNQIKLAIKD